MINIRTYKEYWEAMVNRIAGLKEAHIVANEAQLKEVMNDVNDYPILVATIPSADLESKDADNVAETNTGLVFVPKKVNASDRITDSI